MSGNKTKGRCEELLLYSIWSSKYRTQAGEKREQYIYLIVSMMLFVAFVLYFLPVECACLTLMLHELTITATKVIKILIAKRK